MTPRVGIKDVARLAGVSASTVSVILNQVEGARVSEATRSRVEEAARQLGYSPNGLARGLRTQRSQTIGLVSDVIATTPYAGQLIQGAQDAAWREGYLLMLVNTGGDEDLERHAIATLLQRQVDGILLATMYHRSIDVPPALQGIPLVVLDARPTGGVAPYVIPDERKGAMTAVRELGAHGHRRIGLALDDRDSPAGRGRLEGYREALAEYGIEDDPALVVRASSDSSGGERAGALLLDRPDPPSAIFAFNDQMAVGVYRTAAERGLRIPEDLSVVGFDDLFLIGRELSPGLTTVALPHYAMGEIAADVLLAHIVSGQQAPAGPILVDCPLVRRGSVGPAVR